MKSKKANALIRSKKRKKLNGSSFFRRLTKYILKAVLIFFIVTLAQVLILRWFPPCLSSFMILKKKELFFSGNPHKIYYNWKSYEEISENFALAVIAAEDQKFPDHKGFDLKAIETAYERNKSSKNVKGGSTISQQVAKNLFCWPERSYLRKAVESYYTVLIEILWNKKRILEVYINIAELGPQVYGAEAASKNYFNKAAHELSRNEAALLAAVLPSPSRFSVKKPSEYVIRRREWIKKQMYQLGGVKFLEQI